MQTHETATSSTPTTVAPQAKPLQPLPVVERIFPSQVQASSETNPFARRGYEVFVADAPIARKPLNMDAPSEGDAYRGIWGGRSFRMDAPTAPSPSALGVQAKLTIGEPNDRYEQEADRVAAQVMSMAPPAPIAQRQVEAEDPDEIQTKPLAETITPLVQRSVQRQETEEEDLDAIQAKWETCEPEEPIQRAATDMAQAQPDLESRLNGSKGRGSSLPEDVQSFMEPRFGADFSQVRVHTGSESVQMSEEIGAQAFTHRNDIYFGAGKSPANSDLTAHELTHVVQQTGGIQTSRSFISCQIDGSGDKNSSSQNTTASWLDLPRSSLKKGSKGVEKKKGKSSLTAVDNTPNKDPELIYAPHDQVDLSSIGKEPIEDDAKDKIISNIVAARNAIPKREISRNPYGNNPVGNFHDPSRAKDDPIAQKYNKWLGGSIPTDNFDPAKVEDQKKWQIFQKTILLEGQIGTITTFDGTLTIGMGFSSAGKNAEKVMGKTLSALPEVKNLAFQAGLLVKQNKTVDSFMVVDTNNKWILEGTDASNYVQTNKELLSLIINVTQGNQTQQPGQPLDDDERIKQRQAMLNAQWNTFLDGALRGIPAEILQWSIDSVVLAVHARHATESTFPWAFWMEHNNTDIKAMVSSIYQRLKETKQMYWLVNICGGMYKHYADQVEAEDLASDYFSSIHLLQMSDLLQKFRALNAESKLKARLEAYNGQFGGRPRAAMQAVLHKKSSMEIKQGVIASSDFAELPEDQQNLIKKELALK